MSSNADKTGLHEDTGQWDWVPVQPRRDRRRTAGAILLAASCLALGVLVGLLSSPIFQRRSTGTDRTASQVPRNVETTRKLSSEPSLALGSPSDATTQPDEDAPTAPVIINKGSAKIANEQPRADDFEQAEANVNAPGRSAKQDVLPKVPAGPKIEATRLPQVLKREDPGKGAPAKQQSEERPLKDYRDLRNYALGKSTRRE